MTTEKFCYEDTFSTDSAKLQDTTDGKRTKTKDRSTVYS